MEKAERKKYGISISMKIDKEYLDYINSFCILNNMPVAEFMENAAMYAVDLIKEGLAKKDELVKLEEQ